MVQFGKENAVEMTKRYVSHVDLPMGRFSIEQGKMLVGPRNRSFVASWPEDTDESQCVWSDFQAHITYHLKCTQPAL